MIARLIIRRVFLGLVTVWIMSILVFFGIEILPGDVADAMLGQLATPETLQAIRDDLGLERPAYVRYLAWLRGFITGDLGHALATGRHIFDLLALHAPMTLLLGGITATIAVPLAISLGLIAAMYPGSLFDRTVTTVTLIVMSGPEFLVATLLVIIFAAELRWVPAVAHFSVDPTQQQMFRGFCQVAEGRASVTGTKHVSSISRHKSPHPRYRMPWREGLCRRSRFSRHSPGTNLRDVVLRDLRRTLSPRRYHLDLVQPAPEMAEVSMSGFFARADPNRHG